MFDQVRRFVSLFSSMGRNKEEAVQSFIPAIKSLVTRPPDVSKRVRSSSFSVHEGLLVEENFRTEIKDALV